jgi:iron complex outermembrane receptor protein
MKKELMALVMVGILVVGAGFMAGVQADVVSKEEVLFMEIPQVVTASKKAENVDKAPSVTYVVTADQIKRWAARSLAEVLKRVPGMRISMRECSVIGSRGFTSDQNDKFVILIDGMEIRNVIQDGSYNMADMPDMDMVERIEVVKGPGSTLWGSDAALGVINIITKKGGDVSGIKISLDGSTNDNRTIANVLAGDKMDNGDYLVSLTLTDSKGFGDQGDNRGGSSYDWGYPNGTDHYANDKISNGKGAVPGDAARYLDFRPGFELYSKIRLGETTIKSRAAYLEQESIWETVYGKCDETNVMKHVESEIENVKDLGNAGQLTSKLGAHLLSYERSVPYGATDPTIKSKMDIMTETGLDAETFLNKTIGDRHNIVVGAKVITTFIGPCETTQYYVQSGQPTGNTSGEESSLISLPPLQDDTYGTYLEDNYSLNDRVTLVGGLGVEYNDLRDKTVALMPRAAAIFQLSDYVTAKYAYNTGFDRPPAEKKANLGRPYGFVRNSEGINEHDLELIVDKDKTRATATFYSYQVDNYFTFGQDPLTGGLGHINFGQALGKGIELDLRHNLWENLQLYANYTYANSTINSSRIPGEPTWYYNIGTDFYKTKDLSVNLNVNGWGDMYHGTLGGADQSLSWSGDGKQLVDLSIVFDNLGGRGVTLTTYAKNLLNNLVPVGMTNYPGYTYEEGVSYGLKFAVKF